MKFLKLAALGLVTVAVLFLLVGLLLPSSAHVERSITIARPPVQVFTVLDGYGQFNKWSPWAEKDPQAKYTRQGPESGPGAKLSWVGNAEVGSGSQTILEARPNELIRTNLDFGDQGTAVAQFRLEPEGAGTKVTWGFDAPFGWNIVSRWFGLLFDRFVGPDYEKGLANLKAYVETFPEADWTGMEIGFVDIAPADLLTTHCSTSRDMNEIHRTMAAAYGRIVGAMRANRLDFAGPVGAITTSASDTSWEFDAFVPVSAVPQTTLPDGVQAARGYAGKAVRGVHVGPYDKLGESVLKVEAWIAAHGLEKTDRGYEQYVSDPGNTPPEQLVSHIVVPVK